MAKKSTSERVVHKITKRLGNFDVTNVPDFSKGLKQKLHGPDGTLRVEFEVQDLTPELAAFFLQNPRDNQRTLIPARVAMYAADLRAGRWTDNLQQIWLDSSLRLADGQHRCSAVIAAGMPIPNVLISIAHDESVLESLDAGAPRSRAQQSKFMGHVAPPAVVASAIIFEACDFKAYKVNETSRQRKIELIDNCKHLNNLNILRGRHLPVTVPAMAVALRTMKQNGTVAFQFWEAAFNNRHNINGKENAAAQAIATWLYNNRSKSGEDVRRETLYRCTTAWNAYVRDVKPRFRYNKAEELPDFLLYPQ